VNAEGYGNRGGGVSQNSDHGERRAGDQWRIMREIVGGGDACPAGLIGGPEELVPGKGRYCSEVRGQLDRHGHWVGQREILTIEALTLLNRLRRLVHDRFNYFTPTEKRTGSAHQRDRAG